MKNWIKALLLAAFVSIVPAAAFAAGTVVLTSTDHVDGQSVTIYTYTLTADAADGSFPATASRSIDGWIIRVETNPGATTPTALWDLALVNNELDVMKGVLANRSATATEAVEAPQPYVRGAVAITPTGNSVNDAVIVLKITVLR